ncbi:MAG TPA: hypothetical protein VMM15_04625 [Bradyrhizobium sp.]|nr:hypothetical protein [Bradyrhizobium sp.]
MSIRSRANGLMAACADIRGTTNDGASGDGAALAPNMVQPGMQQGGRCVWCGCCPEPSWPVVAPSELQMSEIADPTDPAIAPAARLNMMAWNASK